MKPRVVIVGGGQAGVGVAQGLDGLADVTLVDRKDYLEIQYANVRAPVKPSIAAAACVPFADIPRCGTVVKDAVSSVSAGTVHTSGGAVLPFDYLVLAPGCSYKDATFVAPPCGESTVAERSAAATARAAAVAAAPAVVVIGGGPVGVEAAAEVAVAHPDKELVLVTASEALLAGKPAGLSRAARSFLESKGARVVTGQKVVVGKGGRLVCEPSGESLPAGAVPLWCVPGPPNTGFLDGPAVAAAAAAGGSPTSLPPPPTILDGAGSILVDAHLRVRGAATWFALGDAAAIPGVKLGYLARGQAAVVVANIAALEAAGGARAARPDTPLPSAWKPNGGLEMMFVTLGPGAGTAHVGRWLTLPSAVVAAIKSGDLFVGKARRGLGAPPAPAGSV